MIRFKKAEPSDSRTLAETRRKTWEATYRGIYPDEMIDGYDVAEMAERDRRTIEDENQTVYLIFDEDECVGYYCYGTPLYGNYKDFSLCLNSLYLLPPYQRQGYGTSIFSILRHYARIWDIPKFFCCCNAKNLPALAFYKKMGGVVGAESLGHENPAEDQIYFEFYIGEHR